jgi:ABC-2 type transport system ATP-binding protein
MNILKIEKINKYYGNFQALKDLSLSIPNGKIVSILGANGAGKTTFIKIIAGLIHQNSGIITICEEKLTSKSKNYVAYLPDKNFLYQWFKVKDTIEYFACFFNDFEIEKCKKLLKEMQISENQKIRACSKGMQERINIALTLSRKAKLFVFDEPLAAVDPLTREFIVTTIKNNIDRKNSSILISTHLVNDVENLFDNVIIISDGKVCESGGVEELKAKYNMNLEDLFKEVMKNAY